MKKRLLALLLAVLVVSSCLSIGAAADYSPRKTAPDSDNRYYYSNINPFYAAGGLVGQCTWYAFGRAYEILGEYPNLSRGNANQWYNYNKNGGYFDYGSEPRPGAIACYDNAPYGHVAVVEEIVNGVAYVSEFNKNSDKSFHYSVVNSWREPIGYIYLVDPTPAKPNAPNANVVTVNYAAETISFDSSKYEVSKNTGFTNMIANGGSISSFINFAPFSVYVRVKAQGSTPASDPTEVTIPGRATLVLAGSQVDYAKEEFRTSSDYQYSLDKKVWTDCDGYTPISVAAGHDTIYIREAATSTAFASTISEIAVHTRQIGRLGLVVT